MTKTLCVFGLMCGVAGKVTYPEEAQHESYVLFKGLAPSEITLYALHASERNFRVRDAAIRVQDLNQWRNHYDPKYVDCLAARLTSQFEVLDNEHVGLPLEVLIWNVSMHCFSFMPEASPVLRDNGNPYVYADGSRLYYLETKQGLTMVSGFPD